MIRNNLGGIKDDNLIQINLQFKNILDNNTKEETSNNKTPLIITVNQYDTILSLNNIINEQMANDQDQNRKRYIFFHNGSNLNANSAFSLAFLGIKNNDTITVYEESLPNKDIIKYPDDTNYHHAKFSQFYKGEEERLEQSRIRDILLSRIEGTSVFFRKNVFRFEQMASCDKISKKKHSRTIVEDSQDAPSTHMLPQAWSGETSIFPKN